MDSRYIPTGSSYAPSTVYMDERRNELRGMIKKNDDNNFLLPNLPGNGNKYDSSYGGSSITSNGTSRLGGYGEPYNAKTVVFYKEGDNYFSGIRVPICKSRYRNMDSLLDDLNSNISLPYGVRKLTTPHGRNTIRSLEELEHNGKYVAGSSFKKSCGVDLNAVMRFRQKLQEDALKQKLDTKFALQQSNISPTKYNAYRRKLERGRNGVVSLPLTAKQLFFVRNGKPSKIYRALLNPLRPLSFEILLEEVSQGLQVAIFKVYSYQGVRLTSIEDLLELSEARVLAVPRNERPIFRGVSNNDKIPYEVQLPKIKNMDEGKEKSSKIYEFKKDSEKQDDRVGTGSSGNGFTKLASRKLTKQQIFPQILDNNRRRSSVGRRGTPHPKNESKNEDSDSGRPHSNSENEGSLNSNYDRKHSVDYPFADVKEESFEDDDDYEEDEENESEKDIGKVDEGIVVEENEALKVDDGIRSHISDDNDKEIEMQIDTDDEDDTDRVANIHSSLRHEPEEGVSYEKDDKDDEEKRVAAAIVIQKHVRGYLARKNTKRVSFNKTPEVINDEANVKDELQEDINKDNNEAAITIQKHWRGYRERRNIKKIVNNFQKNDELGSSESLESKNDEEVVINNDGSEGDKIEDKGSVFNYMITVFIGNRWAADTESDISIIIYGSQKNSGQQYLKQEANGSKFKQNKMENFLLPLNEYLGDIEKIQVYHDTEGYGGGLFIDRIIISDTSCDKPCQYLFLVNKWFDSGQVDGKLSRILRPICLFYLDGLITINNEKIYNRWELVLHCGNEEGEGGTTSNIEITGYGTAGKSCCKNLYDSRLDNAPSKALFQIDLGDIGQLLKIRIDIDGSGIKPDLYIRKIEMKDLDTNEEFILFCNKWLKYKSLDSNEQGFREFPIYKPGFEPLQLYKFEGKIILNNETKFLNVPTVEVQLFGTLGETGKIVTSIDKDIKSNKYDTSFKLEAVSVGNLEGVRIYYHPSDDAAPMIHGMNILQSIFEAHNCNVNVMSGWMMDTIYIRESIHNPFRYICQEGRLFILEPTDDQGEITYCKEMFVTKMEGLATRVAKKKQKNNGSSKWLLTMTLDHTSNLLPVLTLCGEKCCAKMIPLNLTPIDDKLSFNTGECDLGLLTKIRIEVEKNEKMERVPIDDEEITDHLYINKILLTDTTNGDELRFNDIDATFFNDSVKEFSAIWPDIPPMLATTYQISFIINNILGQLQVFLNIKGIFGDSGFRIMRNDGEEWFGNEVRQTFAIDAISLGPLQQIYIKVEGVGDKYELDCKDISIQDTTTEMMFDFKVDHIFNKNSEDIFEVKFVD